jgi:hypothetical protein
MAHNTVDDPRPSLSEIEPLRPIEEAEEAAYPGMTPRERRQEQRVRLFRWFP